MFSDNAIFMEDMEEIFTRNKKDKDLIEFFEQFEERWNLGIYVGDSSRIINNCQRLFKKRGKAKREISDYIRIVDIFLTGSVNSSNQMNWYNGLDSYLNNKKMTVAYIRKFLSNSILLFTENMINHSGNLKWYSSHGNYRIYFDPGKMEVSIEVKNTNLICKSKRDSFVLQQTSGVFDPIKLSWKGSKGKVTWKHAGYNPSKIYAMLSDYQIDMRKSKFNAKNVDYTNTLMLSKSLKGDLLVDVMQSSKGKIIHTPVFTAYEERTMLKHIFENVDFEGKVVMEGAKFSGIGSEEQSAIVYIHRNGKLFITAEGNRFTLSKKSISGKNAQIIVHYVNGDSLYHPSVAFRYLDNKKQIIATHGYEGHSKGPFFSSYHKMDIGIMEMNWKVNDSLLVFRTPTGYVDRKGLLESANYYSELNYVKLQGRDRYHPLKVVRKCVQNFGEGISGYQQIYELYGNLGVASSPMAVKQVLGKLSAFGFITYKNDFLQIKTTQKLHDYLEANKQEKFDYDIIQIYTEVRRGSNATINLNSMNLDVKGISPITFSQERVVQAVTKEKYVRIKKNRQFEFDGRIRAGYLDIYANNFTFNYDSFKISTPLIDSVEFYVRNDEKNEYNKYDYFKVNSILEQANIILYIDKVENRSGEQFIAEYPILESSDSAFIFYDKKVPESDSSYSRKNFFFKIDPFALDSLNSLNNSRLFFSGLFVSGGIFPDLRETLKIQKDSSLGFVHKVDSSGAPLFGGLGMFYQNIKLDNSGLHGDGQINFITSITRSHSFVFYPDSMSTYANEFLINHNESDTLKAEYPTVVADSAFVVWKPKEGYLNAKVLDKPFKMFENEVSMIEGNLDVTLEGLYGDGVLEFETAIFESKKYTFKERRFSSDSVSFEVDPYEQGIASFLTDNVSTDMDLDKRAGYFRSNDKNTFIDMPINEYHCYTDYFIWQFDRRDIQIGYNTVSLDSFPDESATKMLEHFEKDQVVIDNYKTKKIEFAALNKKNKEGLRFTSNSASFNQKENKINTIGTDTINIADVKIVPYTAIAISANHKMDTITSASILPANLNMSANHPFINAKVAVNDEFSYTATADYNYYFNPNNPDTFETIHFEQIYTKKDTAGNFISVATTPLDSARMFKINPQLNFIGNTTLSMNRDFLFFDGKTSIVYDCKNMSPALFKLEGEVDPANVQIKIPPMTNKSKVFSTYFLRKDSVFIYPAFLSGRASRAHKAMYDSYGYLTYDDLNKTYTIIDSIREERDKVRERWIKLDTRSCDLESKGEFSIIPEFRTIDFRSIGKIKQNTITKKLTIDGLFAIDFFFSDQALQILAAKLQGDGMLNEVTIWDNVYQSNVHHLIGEDTIAILKKEAMEGIQNTKPTSLASALTFWSAKFEWNKASTTFRSDKNVKIGYIAGIPVGKEVKAYIQIKKIRSNDRFAIYLELDEDNWVFFQYVSNKLTAYSSWPDFNAAISNTDKKDRKNGIYSYHLGNFATKKSFIATFLNTNKEETENGEVEIIEENKRENIIIEEEIIEEEEEEGEGGGIN